MHPGCNRLHTVYIGHCGVEVCNLVISTACDVVNEGGSKGATWRCLVAFFASLHDRIQWILPSELMVPPKVLVSFLSGRRIVPHTGPYSGLGCAIQYFVGARELGKVANSVDEIGIHEWCVIRLGEASSVLFARCTQVGHGHEHPFHTFQCAPMASLITFCTV
jgi:hypothetical protein